MAYTEYILPDCNSPAGLFEITLYSEFDDLTVPTKQTIERIGELDDGIDVSPSVQEASTLEIDICDDHSVYACGFWYKVMSGEFMLKFNLEGLYYFFGVGEPLENETTDIYVDSADSVFVRRSTIVLTSLVKVLFDGASADVADELYSHRHQNFSTTPEFHKIWTYVRLIDIFSCLLKTSGLNSTFDNADARFVYDPDYPDFKYLDTEGRPYTFNQLFLYCSIAGETVGGVTEELKSYLFNRSTPFDIHYIRDMISGILNTFQLILRFEFTDGRVRVALCQRGRSTPTKVTMPKLISRKIVNASDKRISGIQVSDNYHQDMIRWMSGSEVIGTGNPPSIVTTDLSLTTLFRAGIPDPIDNSYYPLTGDIVSFCVFGMPTEEEYLSEQYPEIEWSNRIQTIQYYNYESGSYVSTSNNLYDFQDAVCGYVYHRFAPLFKTMECVYGSMNVSDGVTESHENAIALMRTDINDGLGAKTYYATRIVKRPEDNKLVVTWFQEIP